MGKQIDTYSDRLERHLLKRPFQKNDKGCWIWTGHKSPQGYGKFGLRFRGTFKNWRAHRAMWTLLKGEIPKGMMVCHRCDVPSCVNPDHLWLGTAQENTADMQVKGRFAGRFKKRSAKVST